MSFLKIFDFFGSSIKFSFNDKSKIQTAFGGLLSLLIICIATLLILAFGKDFFYKLNPLFYIQQNTLSDYKLYSISNDNFMFAYSLTDANNNPLDETHQTLYFNITYQQFRNQDGFLKPINTTSLNIKDCSINDLNEQNKNLFSYIENKTCIDYQGSQITFGGNFDSELYTDYFYIMIMYCEEGQVNNAGLPCNPKSVSDNMFSNYIYLNSYIQKISIDPSNYTNPISYNLYYTYQSIDQYIIKDYFFYFSEVESLTDNGWILSNTYSNTGLSFEYTYTDYGFTQSYVNTSILGNYKGSINFMSTKNVTTYNRIYQKIQQLLANVGGIISFFIALVKIVIQNYNKLFLEYNLLEYISGFKPNSLFLPFIMIKNKNPNLPINNSSFYNINIKRKVPDQENAIEGFKSESIPNINANRKLFNPINYTINQMSSRISTALNEKTCENNKLNFSFCKYLSNFIKSNLCCLSKEENKGSKLKELMDIRTYLKTTITQMRLNEVLFTKEEQSRLYLDF